MAADALDSSSHQAINSHDINSLWPSDTKWQQISRSTLVQVMAWCLTAPSHYLNQCWLIIKCVLQHSRESNFPWNAHNINLQDDFESYIVKIPAVPPRGQWVNKKREADFTEERFPLPVPLKSRRVIRTPNKYTFFLFPHKYSACKQVRKTNWHSFI